MENIIIYDALSLTSKIHSPQNLIDLIGLSDVTWQVTKGAKGYRQRMYFDCISIHYDGTPDMGVWLEMTGQGCRAFESYGTGNYELLFQEIILNPGEVKLTRLDIAYDDHSGILNMTRLFHDTWNQEYVSKTKVWDAHVGSKGMTVYHGSEQSEILIRIYDKAKERKLTDGRHWIRVEMQLRRDRATQFILAGGSIGEKFIGVLHNYLRYVDPCDFDANRWRWPIKDYWSNLLQDASKLSIYVKPGTEYNLERLANYVFNISGNAVDTAIKILGYDAFMDELRQRKIKPNKKYLALIEESENLRDMESNENGN